MVQTEKEQWHNYAMYFIYYTSSLILGSLALISMILPDNEPKPSSREARGFGFPAEVNDFHSLFPFPFFKFLPHYIPPFGFHGALVTPCADTESWVGGAHLLTE